MGGYTPNQKFYTVSPSELVDVDQHVNYNFRRADERVCPLVGYQYTTISDITGSNLLKEPGFKWYKRYSNAVWNCTSTNVLQQDPNSLVNAWTSSGVSYPSGYTDMNQFEAKVGWSSYNGVIRWRGRVILSGAVAFPANVSTNFLIPPSAARPLKAKYFTVWGGNSSGDFQCFRIIVPASSSSDASFQYIKYGGNGTGPTENFIPLHDIKYSLDDTVV